jgi:hypothetical protein
MFSQKLNRPIALVAAAIAVGVVPTASSAQPPVTAPAPRQQPRPPRQPQGNPFPAAEDPTLGLDRLQGDQSARSTT